MFPIVRLMIAATLASIVALICGFGLLAVFRVSHDPFVRLPAATARLQLVADNGVKSPIGFVSGAPFERGLQVKIPPAAAEGANAPAAVEPHGEETAPALATPSASGAVDATSFADDESTEQLAAPTMPTTNEPPAAAPPDLPASDLANDTSAAQPDVTPPAATTEAAAAAPSPDPATAEPDRDIKSPVLAVPSAELAPAVAVEIAVIEPIEEPPLPRERPSLATNPAGASNPADARIHKAAAKKPKRSHVALRVRRMQRVAAAPYGPPQSSQAPYASTAEQSFGDTQANFRTALSSQPQFAVRRLIAVRYSKIAARKPKESKESKAVKESKQPNAATGGPFVSATNR
jgi:hypothetical protein